MKNSRMILFLLSAFIFTVGCSKKEDAPAPNAPHVGGMWTGTGTDDAIGYYTIGLNIDQSADSAAGTFTINGTVATIQGNVAMQFGNIGGNNINSFTLTRSTWTVNDPANANRVCSGTLTLNPHTGQTSSSYMAFHYNVTDCAGGTWQGGANLTKMIRNN